MNGIPEVQILEDVPNASLSISTEKESNINQYKTKRCSKCNKIQSLTNFYKDQQKMDGLHSSCKDCDNNSSNDWQLNNSKRKTDTVREWRNKNHGKARKYLQKYNIRNRKKLRQWSKEYKKKYPERHRAHVAVANAIKKGTLKKQKCEQCGSTNNVQAHHKDYNKKLEVTWLCMFCHKRLHYPIRD